MPDERTPVDLRSRVGEYSRTWYADERTYLVQNKISSTLNLWLLEGTRWEWVMFATTGDQVARLIMIMRRMGIDVVQSASQAVDQPDQPEL